MPDEADLELKRHYLAELLLRPPTILNAEAMLAAAKIEPDWLVPRRIPLGAITAITGKPGAKKSWLAYEAARATAQGGTWLGLPCATGPVLVLNYDNPKGECGRRFMRMGMQPGDPIFFHAVEGPEALKLPGQSEELHSIVAAIRPRLILIDSMRQSHTADENSSKEMGAVMAQLKSFYRYGAAVIVVHHSAKGDGAPARGSGEIEGSLDATIHVVEDEACWIKHRSWVLTEAEETLAFRVEDVGDRTLVLPAERRQRGRNRQARPAAAAPQPA